MFQRELQLLIAASAVGEITLYRDEASDGQWCARVDHDAAQAPDEVQAARGDVKLWRSLDTAHAWLRSLGWSERVGIVDLT